MTKQDRRTAQAREAGISARFINGFGVDMAHVIRHARKQYATELEREAFIAGYIAADALEFDDYIITADDGRTRGAIRGL